MKKIVFIFLCLAFNAQSQKVLLKGEYQYRHKGQPGDTISNNDTLWSHSVYPNKSYFTSCNIRVAIDSVSGNPSMDIILQAKIYKNNSYVNINSVTWYGTSSDTVIEFNKTEFINKYRYFNILVDANTTIQKSIINNIYFLFWERAESFDVWIQDQTTPPFQFYLMHEAKIDITLTENTQIDSSFVLVSSSHGFTGTGEYISMMQNNAYNQIEVTSSSNDTVYLAQEITSVYTTDAFVMRGTIDMNVDGSITDSIFQFNLRDATLPIDIQTIKVTMRHGTSGDDSKFGDLSALTNGLRVRKENSNIQGLGNYKRNQDFKEFGGVINYEDKAGGGDHSTTIIYDLKEIYGVVIRIDPRIPDIIRAPVRDDVSNLVRLRISLMGQYTLGE